MLYIKQEAYHLYREDAYREFCWSVDAYGAYQPTSYIYLCFESFRHLCLTKGLNLIEQTVITNKDIFPYRHQREQKYNKYNFVGVIIRITDTNDVKTIKEALKDGKNVIGLIPNEMLHCHYYNNNEKKELAIKAAKELKVEDIIPLNTITVNNTTIQWKEITTETKGRLFITSDGFISDGFFVEGYGKSKENLELIEKLIEEFSIFKYPLIRLNIRNNVSIWPCHEQLNIIIELINHGPLLNKAELRVNFTDIFEILNPLERNISNLNTNGKTSFAFQVIPRIDGKVEDYLSIKLLNDNNYEIPVYYEKLDISITPSYGDNIRNQYKQDDIGLTKLLTIYKQTKLFSELKTLPELIKIDIRACLNKIRTVAEKLVKLALKKNNILDETTFVNGIQILQQNKILSSRAIGYLHTIRVIGNLASHPSNDVLVETDVRIASYALSCITEEIIDKNIL